MYASRVRVEIRWQNQDKALGKCRAHSTEGMALLAVCYSVCRFHPSPSAWPGPDTWSVWLGRHLLRPVHSHLETQASQGGRVVFMLSPELSTTFILLAR